MDEVERLLGKMARELASGPRPNCCDVPVEPGRDVTASELKALVGSCRAVFVMVYTPACPYCRMFDPIFRGVGSKYADRAAFVKLNAGRFPYVAEALGVMGTPTVVAFVGSRPADALHGYVVPRVFEDFVQVNLRDAGCPVAP